MQIQNDYYYIFVGKKKDLNYIKLDDIIKSRKIY